LLGSEGRKKNYLLGYLEILTQPKLVLDFVYKIHYYISVVTTQRERVAKASREWMQHLLIFFMLYGVQNSQKMFLVHYQPMDMLRLSGAIAS
jgi:hypothetical protein